MSSEYRQNNPSSIDEPYQNVAAAESISVSVGYCESVSIKCSEPPPQEMEHTPQEMAQPPIRLVIAEFSENSDSASTEDQVPLELVAEVPENSDSANTEEQLPVGLVIEEISENSDSTSTEDQPPQELVTEVPGNLDSANTEEQLPLGLVIEEVQENSGSANTEDQPTLELVTEVPGNSDSANTEEQLPLGLVIEEVPGNSESLNTDNHSVQASIPSNLIVPVFHLSQSIHDDNRLHQFTERLTTYSCWPSQIPQHRVDMALAGFYYTGFGDWVRCAFCGLELACWTKDVEPFSRHKYENPRCSFMEEIRHRAKMVKYIFFFTKKIETKQFLELFINILGKQNHKSI